MSGTRTKERSDVNIKPIDKEQATTLWRLGVPVYFERVMQPGVWHNLGTSGTHAVGYAFTPPCEFITFSWGVEVE